jgi:hypothetical protein
MGCICHRNHYSTSQPHKITKNQVIEQPFYPQQNTIRKKPQNLIENQPFIQHPDILKNKPPFSSINQEIPLRKNPVLPPLQPKKVIPKKNALPIEILPPEPNINLLKERLKSKKNVDFSKVNFDKIEKDISISYSRFKETANTKAIILLGATGVGKSSLANYIIGIPLKGKKLKDGFCIDIIPNNEISSPIGHTTVSETTAPINLQMKDVIIWDTPGFEDTRGPNIDIPNCYSIKETFKNSSKIKVIFVVSHITIRMNKGKILLIE